MPETSMNNVYCYETLLASENDSFEWPEIDELEASSLCYTSGTTGHPKGVLYNHRSTVLHCLGGSLPIFFTVYTEALARCTGNYPQSPTNHVFSNLNSAYCHQLGCLYLGG